MTSILLVEDNPDDEALALRAFARTNIPGDIAVARDGAEALDYLFSRSGVADGGSALPDVVLLDLKLPKIDGLEVLRRIRADERTSLLPVVILTSSSERQDRLTGYRLHCNSYVRKPVDFDEFMDTARQLSLYWLTLNRTASC